MVCRVDAVCRVPCAGTRTLVTRSTARRQNVGGNLSICVHSGTLQSAHRCTSINVVQVCACAQHIYQFVLIRWHRGRLPRVWERRDHGNYLLIIHYYHSPASPSFRVIIPSKHTILSFHQPAQMLLMIQLSCWIFFCKISGRRIESKCEKGWVDHSFLFLLFFAGQLLLITKWSYYWKPLTLCAH